MNKNQAWDKTWLQKHVLPFWKVDAVNNNLRLDRWLTAKSAQNTKITSLQKCNNCMYKWKKWAYIFSLCSGQSGNLWTVTTSKNTATSIFYSARNTASIHKNNLGQPVLPRLQKNPNTASVTGEDPASGLPTLQTLNKQKYRQPSKRRFYTSTTKNTKRK